MQNQVDGEEGGEEEELDLFLFSTSPLLDFHYTTMEGEEVIVNAVASDIMISPVGSVEDGTANPAVPSSASDDDQSSGTTAAVSVLTDELRDKIIKQVEYYFSDENLPNDKYMMGFIQKNKEGYVPIGVIASKMKKLIRDKVLLVAALKESSLLVVSSDCKKVKRRKPLQSSESKKASLFTVFVENLPTDHSIPNLRRIFSEAGKIKNISIHDPQSAVEPMNKAEKFISGKLYAIVEYDCVEAAEKAVTTLNNENDWRNGLRVKLLKQVVKHGQKKKAWRDGDVEKNNDIQGSDQSGHEENHKLNEHHERTVDEKDGEHPPKKKTAHRGRGQGQGHGQGDGRSRGKKYYGTNGHGHGGTSSSYTFEATKPPPGPKMPDGTRGFTMGRGRPLIPSPS